MHLLATVPLSATLAAKAGTDTVEIREDDDGLRGIYAHGERLRCFTDAEALAILDEAPAVQNDEVAQGDRHAKDRVDRVLAPRNYRGGWGRQAMHRMQRRTA